MRFAESNEKESDNCEVLLASKDIWEGKTTLSFPPQKLLEGLRPAKQYFNWMVYCI